MMWSRVLVVGSLALSQRIPVSSLTSSSSTVGGSSSSPSPPTRDLSSSTRSLAARNARSLTSISSSSTSTCPDGKEIDGSSDNDNKNGSSTSSSSLLQATSPAAFSFEKYHLLWSPNAWKKLLGTVVVMLVMPRLNLPNLMSAQGLRRGGLSCHGRGGFVWQNFALPLAASSCCLLQLGLNLLSVGCAGWNSYLGPVRPYFLGVLLVSNWQRVPPPSTLAWRSAVALLPEMVFLYNSWQQQKQVSSSATTAANELSSLQELDRFVLQVDIPTMGCVACINAIDTRLRAVPGVLQASSALKPLGEKGGSANIVIATKDATSATNDIIQAVADAGFDGAVLTSMRPGSKRD